MAKYAKINLSLIMVVCVTALSPGCAKPPAEIDTVEKVSVGWEENFKGYDTSEGLTENWVIKGTPGTPLARFIVKSDSETTFLQASSKNSSGNLITRINHIDLEKTPYLEWEWRAKKLPNGADGRYARGDDQAMGIYVGTGSLLSKKVISYHWDTDTPRGFEGTSKYAGGTVKVKWITLRNKTAEKNKWIVEKRNCAEDFKEAWGFVPEQIYLSVSCNSQYTATESTADLNWIKFVSSEDI
jgi:hypothetical protein